MEELKSLVAKVKAELAALEEHVEKFFTQPPCDNAHVAEGCEQFAPVAVEAPAVVVDAAPVVEVAPEPPAAA